jgi:hypothetical protein
VLLVDSKQAVFKDEGEHEFKMNPALNFLRIESSKERSLCLIRGQHHHADQGTGLLLGYLLDREDLRSGLEWLQRSFHWSSPFFRVAVKEASLA